MNNKNKNFNFKTGFIDKGDETSKLQGVIGESKLNED